MLRRSPCLLALRSVDILPSKPPSHLYSVPTLEWDRGQGGNSRLILAPWAKTPKDLIDRMNLENPALQEWVSKEDHLVLKGGAFVSYLSGKPPADFDLYMMAPTLEKAVEHAEDFLKTAVERARTQGKRDGVEVHIGSRRPTGRQKSVRSERESAKEKGLSSALAKLKGVRHGGVISLFNVPGFAAPVQLNLNPYPDLESIIDEGDADCGRMGLHKNQAYFTDRSYQALESWSLRLDESSGFMRPNRVHKFFHRGWKITLPDLDLNRISYQDHRLGGGGFISLGGGSLHISLAPRDPRQPNCLRVTKMELSKQAKEFSMFGGDSGSDAIAVGTLRHADTVKHNAAQLNNHKKGFKIMKTGIHLPKLANLRDTPMTATAVSRSYTKDGMLNFLDPTKCKTTNFMGDYDSSPVCRLVTHYPSVDSFSSVMAGLVPKLNEQSTQYEQRVGEHCSDVSHKQSSRTTKLLDEFVKAAEHQQLEELVDKEGDSGRIIKEEFFAGSSL